MSQTDSDKLTTVKKTPSLGDDIPEDLEAGSPASSQRDSNAISSNDSSTGPDSDSRKPSSLDSSDSSLSIHDSLDSLFKAGIKWSRRGAMKKTKSLDVASLTKNASIDSFTVGKTTSAEVEYTRQDSESEASLLKQSEPMALTNLYVRRPRTVLALIFAALFMIAGIVVFTGAAKMNKIHLRDYLIWEDPKTWDFDKSTLIQQQIMRTGAGSDSSPLQTQIQVPWTTFLLYNAKTEAENVWTREGLVAVRDLEIELKAMEKFGKTCFSKTLMEDDGVTPVKGLDGEFVTECDLANGFKTPMDLIPLVTGRPLSDLESLTDDQLQTALTTAIQNDDIWRDFSTCFDKDVSVENPRVRFLRSMMLLAGPLSVDGTRYESMEDRPEEQVMYVEDFQMDVRELWEGATSEEKFPDVERRLFAHTLFIKLFEVQLNDDIMWMVYAALFVFFYIWFHVGSFFMAVISILMICLSFPLTQFIYTFICGVMFNTPNNQVAIFMVFGVAADDVFVFADAWKQSANYPLLEDNKQRRMAYAFRRAQKSIFVTSSTTCVAFLANALSPLQPTSAFGIFAAIIIPVNYILMILMTPPAMMIYETSFKNRCSLPCSKKAAERRNSKTSPNDILKKGHELDEKKMDFLTRVLAGPVNKCVMKCKWVIIAVFIPVGVLAFYTAMQIEPLTKEDKYLPEGHPILPIKDIMVNDFTETTNSVDNLMVDIHWGIKDLDRSNVRAWEVDDLGELVMDDEFDMSAKESQVALLTLCADLRSRENMVQNGLVTCWIEEMARYVEESTQGRLSLPTEDPGVFEYLLLEFIQYDYAGKKALQNFELGFSMPEEVTIDSWPKLNYMKITAQSVGRALEPRVIREPIYEMWEDFLVDWKANQAPAGLSTCFQNAKMFWALIDGEKALYDSAISGIAISLSLAFVILLFSTLNLRIAIFAILSVGLICCDVVGLMVALGWQMGISESISMVIIIGFSVDYVVHLAAHYVHSGMSSREDRSTESIRDMGVSILSGGITTLGCGLFVFGCGATFFTKFATIMVATVLISLLHALFFFMALIHAAGPQNNEGDLGFWFKTRLQKFKDGGDETTIANTTNDETATAAKN